MSEKEKQRKRVFLVNDRECYALSHVSSTVNRGVATKFQMEGRDWETLGLFFPQIICLLLTVTPV